MAEIQGLNPYTKSGYDTDEMDEVNVYEDTDNDLVPDKDPSFYEKMKANAKEGWNNTKTRITDGVGEFARHPFKSFFNMLKKIAFTIVGAIGDLGRLIVFGDPRPANLRNAVQDKVDVKNARDEGRGRFTQEMDMNGQVIGDEINAFNQNTMNEAQFNVARDSLFNSLNVIGGIEGFNVKLNQEMDSIILSKDGKEYNIFLIPPQEQMSQVIQALNNVVNADSQQKFEQKIVTYALQIETRKLGETYRFNENPDLSTVGKELSLGKIRLHNGDTVQAFSKLMPVKDKDDPSKLTYKTNIYVRVNGQSALFGRLKGGEWDLNNPQHSINYSSFANLDNFKFINGDIINAMEKIIPLDEEYNKQQETSQETSEIAKEETETKETSQEETSKEDTSKDKEESTKEQETNHEKYTKNLKPIDFEKMSKEQKQIYNKAVESKLKDIGKREGFKVSSVKETDGINGYSLKNRSTKSKETIGTKLLNTDNTYGKYKMAHALKDTEEQTVYTTKDGEKVTDQLEKNAKAAVYSVELQMAQNIYSCPEPTLDDVGTTKQIACQRLEGDNYLTAYAEVVERENPKTGEKEPKILISMKINDVNIGPNRAILGEGDRAVYQMIPTNIETFFTRNSSYEEIFNNIKDAVVNSDKAAFAEMYKEQEIVNEEKKIPYNEEDINKEIENAAREDRAEQEREVEEEMEDATREENNSQEREQEEAEQEVEEEVSEQSNCDEEDLER